MASLAKQTISCRLGNHPDAPAHRTQERNAWIYIHFSMWVCVCVSHGVTSVFRLWDVDACELMGGLSKKQRWKGIVAVIFFLLLCTDRSQGNHFLSATAAVQIHELVDFASRAFAD